APAPQFEGEAVLPDGSFKNISLELYKGILGFFITGKYVVLFFYPMDLLTISTFVCPTEIIAFSEQISEFHSCGCEVIAASCDSDETSKKGFYVKLLLMIFPSEDQLMKLFDWFKLTSSLMNMEKVLSRLLCFSMPSELEKRRKVL
ncbi:hypothetical protein MXB_5603, partial [Myxobolus squamalis]